MLVDRGCMVLVGGCGCFLVWEVGFVLGRNKKREGGAPPPPPQ